MNIMEEIFEIRSCILILANDIKIYTSACSTVNKELQDINNGGSSSFKRLGFYGILKTNEIAVLSTANHPQCRQCCC